MLSNLSTFGGADHRDKGGRFQPTVRSRCCVFWRRAAPRCLKSMELSPLPSPDTHEHFHSHANASHQSLSGCHVVVDRVSVQTAVRGLRTSSFVMGTGQTSICRDSDENRQRAHEMVFAGTKASVHEEKPCGRVLIARAWGLVFFAPDCVPGFRLQERVRSISSMVLRDVCKDRLRLFTTFQFSVFRLHQRMARFHIAASIRHDRWSLRRRWHQRSAPRHVAASFLHDSVESDASVAPGISRRHVLAWILDHRRFRREVSEDVFQTLVLT